MAKIQKQTTTVSIPPTRTYSELELRDFHQKIQRFWDPPRTLQDGTEVRRFRNEDLHVAYGAARKVPHGTSFVYVYNSERYRQFMNLWDQYDKFRRGQDWKKEAAVNHQLTAYEQIHQESNVQDELF